MICIAKRNLQLAIGNLMLDYDLPLLLHTPWERRKEMSFKLILCCATAKTELNLAKAEEINTRCIWLTVICVALNLSPLHCIAINGTSVHRNYSVSQFISTDLPH